MFRLIDRQNYRGDGTHDSGWPWICRRLLSESHQDGILLDDFVEDSIQGDFNFEQRDEPWVGFFHHPPAVNRQFAGGSHADVYLAGDKYKTAWESLKLAITLSEDFGNYLLQHKSIHCPVVSLHHPIAWPTRWFDPDEAFRQTSVPVFHFGSFMKNTMLLFDVDMPAGFHPVRVRPFTDYQLRWDRSCYRAIRQIRNKVLEVDRLSSDQLADMLSRSVVVFEFFGLAASNAMLECIIRHTPVLVNKLPAAVEYLGSEYPLFYRHRWEIPKLLNRDTLIAGHDYLARLSKRQFSLSNFVKQVKHLCNFS